jgi:Response regulator receiver domain.
VREVKQRVIAVIDDMFFAAKIGGTAEALGIEVKFARSIDAAIGLAQNEMPAIIIADLHAQTCDPFLLAEKLKSDEKLKTIPLLGFFSHVQTALKQQAEQAGYDRIVPRSYFSNNLAEILKGNF